MKTLKFGLFVMLAFVAFSNASFAQGDRGHGRLPVNLNFEDSIPSADYGDKGNGFAVSISTAEYGEKGNGFAGFFAIKQENEV